MLNAVLFCSSGMLALVSAIADPSVVKEEVCVSVNGHSLTIGEVDRGSKLRLKCFDLANANKKTMGVGQNATEEQLAKHRQEYANRLGRSAVSDFIRRGVLLAYANDLGLTNTVDAFGAKCEEVAKHLNFASYGDMRKSLTEDEVVFFENSLRGELLASTAEAHIRAHVDDSVNEKEVDEAFARLKAINAIADATNRLVWARATNIYEQVKSRKIDFNKAVQDYSEQDPKEEDGFFSRDKLSRIMEFNPSVAEYIFLKKPEVGTCLPPLEGDNGVVVLKVVDREDDVWELHAVFLRLAQDWKVPSGEQMRDVLRSNKVNEGYRKKFQEIYSRCQIEFPQKKK